MADNPRTTHDGTTRAERGPVGQPALRPAGDGADTAIDSHSGQKASVGFLATYLATCLVLLFFCFGINVLGNSQTIYPGVLHPSRSERAWKSRRLEQLVRDGKSPQILILGNSRIMAMNPAQIRAITGKRVFNYGVFGATMVDSLAQFRYACQIEAKPELLVLAVDEWSFFEPPQGETLQLASHGGLFREVPFPENMQIVLGILKSTTIKSTLENAEAIAAADRSGDKSTLETASNYFLDDGYMLVPRWSRRRANGTYRMPPLNEQNTNWKPVLTVGELAGGPQRTFERQLQYMDELLALAKSIHSDVRVLMPPLRPEFEDYYGGPSVRQLHADLARRVRALCQRDGCKFYNFTNLESFDGDPSEFWDGTHQTLVNLRRMTNVLFGVEPDKIFADVPTDLEILDKLPAAKQPVTP